MLRQEARVNLIHLFMRHVMVLENFILWFLQINLHYTKAAVKEKGSEDKWPVRLERRQLIRSQLHKKELHKCRTKNNWIIYKKSMISFRWLNMREIVDYRASTPPLLHWKVGNSTFPHCFRLRFLEETLNPWRIFALLSEKNIKINFGLKCIKI